MWLENSPWNAILYPLGESACFIFLTSEYWLVGDEGKKGAIQPLSSGRLWHFPLYTSCLLFPVDKSSLKHNLKQVLASAKDLCFTI